MTLSCVSAATNTLRLDNSYLNVSEKWLCEYCDLESVFAREIAAGLGGVSYESDKFGEYTGFDDKGPYALIGAQVRYRATTGDYIDAQLRDLSLVNQQLDIDAGRQGDYSVALLYQEQMHESGDVKTPYQQNGRDQLQLPPNWVAAGSTAGMTSLAGAARSLDLKQQRKSLRLTLDYFAKPHWNTSLEFHHQRREGKSLTAGAFLLQSAQLVAPVDYTTNEISLRSSYVMRDWQLALEYFVSFFNNQIASMRWQNAYNPIVPGVDEGLLALPPSNRFHQLSLASAYRWGHMRINGNVAMGRVEQDDALLPVTENSNLSQALPESRALARLDTFNVNVQGSASISHKLTLNAFYRNNSRDNKSPVQWFDWVSSDVYGNVARRNLPYSFSEKKMGFVGLYHFNAHYGFDTGFEINALDRTHQQVAHNVEDEFWGQFSFLNYGNDQIQLKFSHADRRSSGFHLNNEVYPPENPLLAKYNMANRIRNRADFRLSLSRGDYQFNLNYVSSMEDYSKSILGLIESHEFSVGTELMVFLDTQQSIHFFVTQQRINSTQQGSQSFGMVDWESSNSDSIDLIGLGWKKDLLLHVLSIGLEISVSKSVGDIRVETGTANSEFPSLINRVHSLHAVLEYHRSKSLTYAANYWFERFSTEDWMVDDLGLAELPKVLNVEYQPQDYRVHLILLNARYRF